MNRLPLWLFGAAFLCACGGNAPPAVPPSDEPARLECDRLAARAIQRGNPGQAARLSSEASRCYAALDSLAS